MGSREERREIVKRGGGGKHSLNQKEFKETEEARVRYFGRIDRAVDYLSRQERIKRSEREFEEEQGLIDQEFGMQLLKSRRQMQLNRALKRAFVEGAATSQDIDYIARQGKVSERFTILKGIEDSPEVIVTIVDFTRPPV